MILRHGTRQWLTHRLRSLFGAPPPRVQIAALPWRHGDKGLEIMLVTTRDTGRWVLPKGWPEGSERLCDAAAREALEEAGVSGAIGQREIGRYYYGKRLQSGLECRCEVLIFALEVDRVADKWAERKKRRRQWFSPGESAALVTEPDLGELLASFAVNPRQFAA